MTSTKEPGSVGAVLRARRESLRLSGSALASRVGMTQAKISRIETGRTAVTPQDARRLAEALQMEPAQISELVRQAGGEDRMELWRPESSEIARKQSDVEQMEMEARTIQIFQPAAIPGLLQVDRYAEAVMRSWYRLRGIAESAEAEADLIAAVAARLRRQQILTKESKTFRFVMTESTLSNRIGTARDMLGQIEKIREIARRTNVTISIVPADAALSHPPSNSVELLDDRMAIIDLFTISLTTEAVLDLRGYQQLIDNMAAVATTDIDPILDKYDDLYHALSARR